MNIRQKHHRRIKSKILRHLEAGEIRHPIDILTFFTLKEISTLFHNKRWRTGYPEIFGDKYRHVAIELFGINNVLNMGGNYDL